MSPKRRARLRREIAVLVERFTTRVIAAMMLEIAAVRVERGLTWRHLDRPWLVDGKKLPRARMIRGG